MVGQARVAEWPADVRFIPSALAHVRFVPIADIHAAEMLVYARNPDLSSFTR